MSATPTIPPRRAGRRAGQRPIDAVLAAAVLAFTGALVLYPVRSNDVWWLLGTARRMVETHAFITSDPFTFTVFGSPWIPHAWLAALVFYAVHAVASAPGLIALRALVTVATVAVLLYGLARAGVRWAPASVLLVLAVLVSQNRFMVRAQLFEYLFLAVLVAFLLTSHESRGRMFYVLPVAMQVLWVNMHPSFVLGPVLAALFFAGEWIAQRLSPRISWLRPLHQHDYARAWRLVGLMTLACLVDPRPIAFLVQPFTGQQRELLSHFTMEWKSPFDPALASQNFHPYYEILLAVSALGILARLRSFSPGPVLLTVATALLSLQSHRFRVEFALVSAPLAAVMLARPWPRPWPARARRWTTWTAVGAGVVMMAGTFPGRFQLGSAVAARYPDRALAFVVDNDIAHRPFNTIGFGSYMIWDLYGKRKTFIDGRNFDPGLYRDFLATQTDAADLRRVIARYRLDAFVLPSVVASDAGITNIHRALARWPRWRLVHMDATAFVYVDSASVAPQWLDAHEYRVYHPLTLGGRRLSRSELEEVVAELARACREAPRASFLWLDNGLALEALGRRGDAIGAFERVTDLEPKNPVGWQRLAEEAAAAGDTDRATSAYVTLARVYLDKGEREFARDAARRALGLEPGNAQARKIFDEASGRGRAP